MPGGSAAATADVSTSVSEWWKPASRPLQATTSAAVAQVALRGKAEVEKIRRESKAQLDIHREVQAKQAQDVRNAESRAAAAAAIVASQSS